MTRDEEEAAKIVKRVLDELRDWRGFRHTLDEMLDHDHEELEAELLNAVLGRSGGVDV